MTRTFSHWYPFYHTNLTNHDVTMETEGEPVGEHLLCDGLRPTQQELGVGVGDSLANELGQQLLQNTATGGRERQDAEKECRDRMQSHSDTDKLCKILAHSS